MHQKTPETKKKKLIKNYSLFLSHKTRPKARRDYKDQKGKGPRPNLATKKKKT